MTGEIVDEGEIIEGIDVDHIDDRPDELDHVGIYEGPENNLEALGFTTQGPPGYDQIDVDLMEYDDVCRYVENVTDYERRIDFTRIPPWPPAGTTVIGPAGGWW